MTKRDRRWAKPNAKKPRRTETAQPGLFAGVTPGERNAGNGIHCQVRRDRIDTAVCIVQQSREPDKCVGCGKFRS
ncbi:MAG: hypothetical protein ACYDG4_16645 [Desulfuromonadaceae bacterium]